MLFDVRHIPEDFRYAALLRNIAYVEKLQEEKRTVLKKVNNITLDGELNPHIHCEGGEVLKYDERTMTFSDIQGKVFGSDEINMRMPA